MISKEKSVEVNSANQIPIFSKFQEHYTNVCKRMGENDKHELEKTLKLVKSFVFEYLPFIYTGDLREHFYKLVNQVKEDVMNDKEFQKLNLTPNKSTMELLTHNQKYYEYVVRLYRIVGMFGDELSKTFMPNKTDRDKLLKFSYNNAFFDYFATYKNQTAYSVANFNLISFKEGITAILGFYYAYYLFVDEMSRSLIEKVFSHIFNIVLNKKILILIIANKELSPEKIETLKLMDSKMHDSVSMIFFRCSFSFSQYNVLPKIQHRVLIDRSTI